MKLRQIRRVIWFAVFSSFHAKAKRRISYCEDLAAMSSRYNRMALIKGNAIAAKYYLTRASYYSKKAEHYRRFLRTH